MACRGAIGKYWNGYNGDLIWFFSCFIWINSVVEGLRCLNNGICDYWCHYRVDCIRLILKHVLGGGKGRKYGLILYFWYDILFLLSLHGI